ncbi:MAG: glycosyltransferase [Thermoleophilia bacterium]|nr:glycosyltransferase [Thermoleophilia bacterium]
MLQTENRLSGVMRSFDIALIMTLLNEEKDLPGLLESIDSQTLRPDEVVICDSGSSDATMQIINSWRDSCPLKVTIIEKPGLNIAQGRNLAINAVDSSIISVTDGSCVLQKDWLQEITRPMRSNEQTTGIVYGVTVAVGEGRVGHQFAVLHSLKTNGRELSDSEHSSRSVAFLRSVWDAVGGYPEWMTLAGEDTYFFMQVEKISGSSCAQDAKAYWHHGEESLVKVFQRHKRNSLGDGEAHLAPLRYLCLLGIYLAAVIGLFLSILSPVLLPLPLMLLIAVCFRLTPSVLRARLIQIDTFTILPAITLLRDLGMVTGYITGLKRSLSKRLSGHSVGT